MSSIMGRNLLTVDNEVFRCFTFYSCLLFLKVFAVAVFTPIQRFRKKAFISPEDTKLAEGSEVREDPDVERVRRAHLNDLENIPIFFMSSLLFVSIDPHVMLAKWLFRIYTIARYLHTLVYLLTIPQPARALCFAVGITCNFIILAYVVYNSFSI
ncbi:unnamed protein product [Bemisia tabaci]|uniref:Microsomal glutathione S-transferase 1 n=1 Tax=Bemisia tabaci TaxID=7038 RepID=A0A223FQY9_BEMTA|nr:PREDICTED: microsomal glutathione S-transferase 1-like [Bemisia tabaci]AST11616.1 glutathione S-transferase m2 [Bemisia tabaci]QHU80012.1 microsomal glutathione S-transferase 2 [Bemisia tabaci]CAH0385721.1 unnamed protein product [Bemisia tabaci]